MMRILGVLGLLAALYAGLVGTYIQNAPGHEPAARTQERVRGNLIDVANIQGRYGIITLPALIVSLRSPKETAGSFPSAGYTSIEGVYFAYRFAFFVGAPLAYFSTSLGTLAQRAEVGLELERPLGSLPLSLTAAAGAGWHHEVGLNIETTRLQYSVGLKSSDIQFGPQTDWQTAWKWTDAVYGTGDRQGVLRLNSAVTHHLATDATLTLSRITLRVYPATLSAPPPPPLAPATAPAAGARTIPAAGGSGTGSSVPTRSAPG